MHSRPAGGLLSNTQFVIVRQGDQHTKTQVLGVDCRDKRAAILKTYFRHSIGS